MTHIETLPTKGQLERRLSQSILILHRDRLGQLPSKVSCQLFDNKIAIVVEDIATTTEKLLLESYRKDLAKQTRSITHLVFLPMIEEKINEVVQQKVVTIVSDYCLEHNYMGMIAILEQAPSVRPSRRKKLSQLDCFSQNGEKLKEAQ